MPLRVLLEVGTKGRRVVAAATDWPGLDRWGKNERDALEKLTTYLPRYRPVAEGAGLGGSFARQRNIEVVERYTGSSSTDFWGIAHVPSKTEHEVLSPKELERRLDLLQSGWRHFDAMASSVSKVLRPGPRSEGRSREQIIRHTYGSEPDSFSRKVEVRTLLETVLTKRGLTKHRAEFLEAIRSYNAERKMARSWPIQFLIRRTAHHVLDHTWEMEDRDAAT